MTGCLFNQKVIYHVLMSGRDAMDRMGKPTVEFWRLRRVCDITGLSKSEVYRRISAGSFPAARSYPDAPSMKFWVSTEVINWQRGVIGPDEFDLLLSV